MVLPSMARATFSFCLAVSTMKSCSESTGTLIVPLELAEDLHGHLDVGGDGLALVVFRPGLLHGHSAGLRGLAGQLPHFLDHMRGEGAEHAA